MKRQVNNNNTIARLELNKGNSKKYKFEANYNIEIYVNKSKDHLLGLYYLISWKKLLRRRKYLGVIINYAIFLKAYYYLSQKAFRELTITFSSINLVPAIKRSIVKPTIKSKEKTLTK